MALIVCRDCGTPMSDQASVCPSCGRPLLGAAEGGSQKGRHGTAFGIAAALVSLGLLTLGMILGKVVEKRLR